MSYDVASGSNSVLERTSGTVGRIAMAWVKYLSFTSGGDAWYYAFGNNDDWASGLGGGTFGGSATSLYGFTQNNNNSAIATGSDTSWIFVAIVENDGVGATYYYRHEGETSFSSVSVADTSVNGAGAVGLAAPLSQFSVGVNHKRITAYKEWSSSTSLTVDQIFAESTQNAPIVTAALTNYLPCDSGHTVGVDQSAASQDWTVSGTTITINADEPTMAAIAYVGSSTASGSGSNAVVADPGFAGNFLLAVAEADGTGVTFTAPDASWITIFGPSTLTTDSAVYQVWYKKSGVGSGNYTFTSTVGSWGVALAAYAGADPTTPLQVTPVSETHDDGRSSPASVVAPTLTTTADGCRIIWVGVNDPNTNTGTVTFTPPSGYASRVSFVDSSGWDIIEVADKGQDTAGVVGSATGTTTRSSTNFGVVGMHIALALAGSGGGGTTYDVTPSDTLATTDFLAEPRPLLVAHFSVPFLD